VHLDVEAPEKTPTQRIGHRRHHRENRNWKLSAGGPAALKQGGQHVEVGF
jgi:hypothetical protein